MIEYESNAVFLHRADYEELLDLVKRTRADFENYQKRAHEERRALRADAVGEFVRQFLPALDGLEAALAATRAGNGDARSLEQGLALLQKEFVRVLAQGGVARMQTIGKPFDPNYHEAAGEVESADAPEGTVAEELRPGWLVQGRVLRAAVVKVAKPKKI